MKKQTKIVTLEGITSLSNKDLEQFCKRVFTETDPEGQPYFALTQRPRVQVAQGPRKK